MSTRPAIGDRLRQARVAAGMSQTEVVDSLAEHGVSLTKAGLSKYERGGSVPKPRTLRTLAKVLGVDTAFFLEERAVSIEWLAFRKASRLGKKQQERIKTLAFVQVAALHSLRRALEPNRQPRPMIRTVVTVPADAESAADQLRECWGLGDRPIGSVTSVIEDAGGIVVESGDEEDLFEGLSGWLDDKTPVIVVSSSVSDDRKRFSLAHELGHLAMDVGEIDSAAEEKLAHRFAAAFLVTSNTARRELGERRRRLDFRELAVLKQKHGLSMQAWIYRAADLGIIDQSHARTLFAEMSARGWRRREPIAFNGHERLMRLQQLAVRALAEGVFTSATAERLFPGVQEEFGAARVSSQSSMRTRRLMELPRLERELFLEQAVALVQDEYVEGGALSGFESLAEEDHHDISLEER